MKTILKASIVFIAMVITLSFVSEKPWVVPDKDKAVKNTVTSDATSLAAGKSLYGKLCKSCHGVSGKGDGTKAKELDTPTGSFLDDSFVKQTDGEVFYKIRKGRDDMPSFTKETEPSDVWNLINYIRTFKK